MSLSRQEQRILPPASASPLAMAALEKLRVAIVHYWFVSYRGGERTVEAMTRIFPNADIFSLLVDPEKLSPTLRNRSIRTSFLQKLPGSKRWHRHLLPLYPLALEQFDLRDYDLVISSESGPAKGVITGSRTCHVCYCHSPMRYLWDFYHGYRNGNGMGALARPVFSLACHYMRMWDAASAQRVDHFAANSRNVAARVRKHYRRESTIIHPPVNVRAGYLANRLDDYYLCVAQLVDYKRVDLAIAACNKLKRPLHIVGEGEEYQRLSKLAGPTIKFCGTLSDEDIREQYAHCRALLFPGEEDFGLVPVEAMSCGRPVIAYDRGGATETVNGSYPQYTGSVTSSTGMFFSEQTPESLMEAVLAFERVESDFAPFLIRQSAQRFDESHFRERFANFLVHKLAEFHNAGVQS